MAKVTLENIAQHLQTLDKRFDSVDGQLGTIHAHLDIIYKKQKEHDHAFKLVNDKLKEHDRAFEMQDELLNLIADRASHYDDDLTTIKKSLQHQRA